jgi:hypothetical protein
MTTPTTKELERTLKDMTMARPDAIRPHDPSSTKKELNTTLLQTIVDHWEGRHFVIDYAPFMIDYRNHADSLCHAQEALPVDPKN